MIALLLLPLLLPAQGSSPKEPSDSVRASGSATPSEESDTSELRAIGRDFLDRAFVLTPWTPELRGWKGPNIGLDGFEYGQRTNWLNALRGLRERLGDLNEERMSGRERAERRALAAQIETRLALFETRAPERWNALMHVERVERMLVAEQAPLRPPSERRLAILKLLLQFPAYWKQAQANLVSPKDDWSRDAMIRLGELTTSLAANEEDLLRRFPAGAQADKARAAYGAAINSARRFQLWLEKSPTGLGVSVTHLEADRWLRLVRSASGTPYGVDEIRTRVLFDLARREHLDGERWRARTNSSVDIAIVGRLEEELLDAGDRAMELASRAGVLPELSPRGVLGFTVSDLGRPFQRDVLYLPERELDRAFVNPTELRGADPATLTALGIRYGYPGLGLLRHEARTAKSPLARVLWNRALFEGWGLYALDWMLRIDWVENDFAREPELAAEASHQIALEEARLLASLEQHAIGLSEDEATEAFQRRTGVSRNEAREEVRRSLTDPLRGIGTLGWMELLRQEEAYGKTQGPGRAIGQNLAAAMSSPFLRPVDRE